MPERSFLLSAGKMERKIGGPWRSRWVMNLPIFLLFAAYPAVAWTGRIRGSIFCDVCGDSDIGPEDHALQGCFFHVCCLLIILIGCLEMPKFHLEFFFCSTTCDTSVHRGSRTPWLFFPCFIIHSHFGTLKE